MFRSYELVKFNQRTNHTAYLEAFQTAGSLQNFITMLVYRIGNYLQNERETGDAARERLLGASTPSLAAKR